MFAKAQRQQWHVSAWSLQLAPGSFYPECVCFTLTKQAIIFTTFQQFITLHVHYITSAHEVIERSSGRPRTRFTPSLSPSWAQLFEPTQYSAISFVDTLNKPRGMCGREGWKLKGLLFIKLEGFKYVLRVSGWDFYFDAIWPKWTQAVWKTDRAVLADSLMIKPWYDAFMFCVVEVDMLLCQLQKQIKPPQQDRITHLINCVLTMFCMSLTTQCKKLLYNWSKKVQ